MVALVLGLTFLTILLFDAIRSVFLVYHKRYAELKLGRYISWERYYILRRALHFWEW